MIWNKESVWIVVKWGTQPNEYFSHFKTRQIHSYYNAKHVNARKLTTTAHAELVHTLTNAHWHTFPEAPRIEMHTPASLWEWNVYVLDFGPVVHFDLTPAA